MHIAKRVAIPCSVILIITIHAATAATPDDCLDGRKQALIDGHFSGAIVCSRKDATFRLVGMPNGYDIYDYQYRFSPFEGAHVMHGSQRLLVFRGRKYIGQYSMSPPPETTVAVSRHYVVLSKEGAESVRIDFSKGPPLRIFFDGATESFFR